MADFGWRAAAMGLVCVALTGCTLSLRASVGALPEGGGAEATVPLPPGREALLEEADRSVAAGPARADLARSRAAAEAALRLHPSDGAAGWRLARALYLATLTAEAPRAAELASRCIPTAQASVAACSDAEAALYLALCFAARARARVDEALDLLPRMVEAAEEALRRDPTVEHAAPHRVLGGIYLRAPAWPTSVGDPDTALEHLYQAVHLAPEWAENHLIQGEALLVTGDAEGATAALKRARRALRLPIAAGWRAFWAADARQLEQRLQRAGARPR
jgi:tetratricopeptide (TPR) repeat protein